MDRSCTYVCKYYVYMDGYRMYVCMYKYIYIVGWMMNGCVDA